MYDLIVIGAGSAGVRCARIAASLGARVVLVEARDVGGTCVNRGCVPKKLLVYGADARRSVRRAQHLGVEVTPGPVSFDRLQAAVQREVGRLVGAYGRTLERAGVEVRAGSAVVVGPNRVRVGDEEITGAHIVVATGGEPIVPSFPGAQHVAVSDDVFELTELPRRVVVVGGGYIGVEMAGIFAGLGAQVSLVVRGPELLNPSFDHDVRHFLAEQLRRDGVDVRLGVAPLHVSDEAGGYRVVLEDHDEIEADYVLAATGRRPKTAGLGLEAVGVALGLLGEVVVDAEYRTSVPSIRAIGDVTGGIALTPVATALGSALARHLVLGEPMRVALDLVPTAVFSHPSVAMVGSTEAAARAAGYDVVTYKAQFTSMRHAIAPGPATLVKLVVDRATDRVLGLHMVGDDAGEVVQGFAVALRAGATKAHFDQTIGIHPTVAEEFVTLRTPGG